MTNIIIGIGLFILGMTVGYFWPRRETIGYMRRSADDIAIDDRLKRYSGGN